MNVKKIFTLLCFVLLTIVSTAQKAVKKYIKKYEGIALKKSEIYQIPASIILGIAMHESGNGNSKIAQKLNNQFGVKGNGKIVIYKHNKKIHTSYKKYDSVMDSFQDFARIMTERKQFSHLAESLTQYDYEKWVKGIQRAGYASSRKWASQVLGIIHKYNLNDFDQEEAAVPNKPVAQNNQ